MSISIIAYKRDFFSFLRRNTLKMIICAIIVGLVALVAINNGLTLPDYCDYFEKDGTAIFCVFRQDRGLFSDFFSRLFECAILLAIVILCSFNDFLSLFSLAVLVIKSYKAIFVDIIVIRFLGAGAIVYFVLHLIVMLCCLFAYSCACCLVINSSNRYCYGFKEMGGVCKELIFVVIGLVALVIVETE